MTRSIRAGLAVLTAVLLAATALTVATAGTATAAPLRSCHHHNHHCPSSSASGSTSHSSSSASISTSTSTSVSTSTSGAICTVSSLDRADCGPYRVASIRGGPNDSGTTIRQEVWNLKPALHKQVTTVFSASHWQTVVNAALGNTEVNNYPDVSDTVTTTSNTPQPVSGYTSLTSTYAENMHATANTDAEAAYDIWLNNFNLELMIWVDNHGQRPAGTDTGVNITAGGVSYRLWDTSGHSTVSLVRSNAQSGSVDILGLVKALIARGTYASSVGFSQIDFGFETPSTGGLDETFEVTGYTLAYS